MAVIHIIKAHAYGNDFLYVPADEVAAQDRVALARTLCDRHTGVGADGLVLYVQTLRGATMTLVNADGSPSEVSGNGVRGLAAIAMREWGDRARPAAGRTMTIGTDAGEKVLTCLGEKGGRYTFEAAMGRPEAVREVDLEVDRDVIHAVALTVGNPQCVVLGPLPDAARFRQLGAALSRHPTFPAGTNVELAEIESPSRVRILIWERGVGPTLASGTGACAAAVAAAAYGGAHRDVEVASPGGSQRVVWREDSVYLTGWAEVVYAGQWLGVHAAHSCPGGR